jgi:hypothetical protein
LELYLIGSRSAEGLKENGPPELAFTALLVCEDLPQAG